jgi:hypothetical protein
MPQAAGILCAGLAAGLLFETWQDVLLGQALWIVELLDWLLRH